MFMLMKNLCLQDLTEISELYKHIQTMTDVMDLDILIWMAICSIVMIVMVNCVTNIYIFFFFNFWPDQIVFRYVRELGP